MSRYKKIIFLDIDGVLNHCGTNLSTPWDPDCIAELNRVQDYIPGVVIVVTSEHRLHYKGVKIREFMNEGLKVKIPVIDTTPRVGPDCPNRGEEIQQWLDETRTNVNEVKMVIIDDKDNMGHLNKYLIQTNPYEGGLTKEIADKVIAAFTEED